MALLPLLSPHLGGSYLLLIGERVMIFAIAALSLELLIGVGGLVSFGHAAFLGIGAYGAGIAASHGLGTLSVALPAALAASALFALATGAIAVRTRGVYFIMITLAFGQMAFFVATSLAPYGGDDGLTWPTRTLVFGTRAAQERDGVLLRHPRPARRHLPARRPPHRLPLRPRAARAHRQRNAHAGDRLRALPLPSHRLRHCRHDLRAGRLPARQPGRVRQPRLHALAALRRADHHGAAGRHRHALWPDRRRARLPAAGGDAVAPHRALEGDPGAAAGAGGAVRPGRHRRGDRAWRRRRDDAGAAAGRGRPLGARGRRRRRQRWRHGAGAGRRLEQLVRARQARGAAPAPAGSRGTWRSAAGSSALLLSAERGIAVAVAAGGGDERARPAPASTRPSRSARSR